MHWMTVAWGLPTSADSCWRTAGTGQTDTELRNTNPSCSDIFCFKTGFLFRQNATNTDGYELFKSGDKAPIRAWVTWDDRLSAVVLSIPPRSLWCCNPEFFSLEQALGQPVSPFYYRSGSSAAHAKRVFSHLTVALKLLSSFFPFGFHSL